MSAASGSGRASGEGSRANHRRRLHTAFDRLLDLANTADPAVQQDARFLFERIAEEVKTFEPDTMLLWELQALRRSLAHHQAVLDTMVHVLSQGGLSWREIGDGLGMSPQGAHSKYAKREPSDRDLDSLERYLAKMASFYKHGPPAPRSFR